MYNHECWAVEIEIWFTNPVAGHRRIIMAKTTDNSLCIFHLHLFSSRRQAAAPWPWWAAELDLDASQSATQETAGLNVSNGRVGNPDPAKLPHESKQAKQGGRLRTLVKMARAQSTRWQVSGPRRVGLRRQSPSVRQSDRRRQVEFAVSRSTTCHRQWWFSTACHQ